MKKDSYNITLTDLHQEYLSWNIILNHLTKKQTVILIKLGILPIRIMKCFDRDMIPIFSACMFGQAKRKPWRNKGTSKKSHKVRRDTNDHAGSGTSTDQLHGNQAGLVAQSSGKLTSAKVPGATLFV